MAHEYATIKATLHGFESKEYSCGDCQARFGGRPTAFLDRGCKTPQKVAIARIGDDLSFRRCPGNFYSHSVAHWYRAYTLYEKGVMPFPGSYIEQPNKVVELFSIFEAWKVDREVREHKKAMQAQKAQGKRGR